MDPVKSEAVGARWIIRYVVVPVAFVLILVAVVGGVFIFRDMQMQEFLNKSQSDDSVEQISQPIIAGEPDFTARC